MCVILGQLSKISWQITIVLWVYFCLIKHFKFGSVFGQSQKLSGWFFGFFLLPSVRFETYFCSIKPTNFSLCLSSQLSISNYNLFLDFCLVWLIYTYSKILISKVKTCIIHIYKQTTSNKKGFSIILWNVCEFWMLSDIISIGCDSVIFPW